MIHYIPHRSFSVANEKRILAPMPAGGGRVAKPPKGLPAYLEALYGVPLLTPAQEKHLFRAYNYLKWKANEFPKFAQRLMRKATKIRNQIMSANLRLVVNIAKKQRFENFDWCVSDGNVSLLKAIEGFDFSKGFKFGTYATHAIRRNFWKTIPIELRKRDEAADLEFGHVVDHRTDEIVIEAGQAQAQVWVAELLGKLPEKYRRVIQGRYGLGEPGANTLAGIALEMGNTKEAVRQIQIRALEQLRMLAGSEAFV